MFSAPIYIVLANTYLNVRRLWSFVAKNDKKRAHNEILRLFELARSADEDLACSYVKKARKLAETHRISLREYNRKHCRNCFTFWHPGKVRVRTRQGCVVMTCMVCGSIKRIPTLTELTVVCNTMKIAQGAEAVLTRTPDGVVKSRPEKRYRHPDLDLRMRTRRTRAEARIIGKAARAGVRVPLVSQRDEFTLVLEDIPGVPVKDVLDSRVELAEQIGTMVAKLHSANLIHADLTTSNMMFTGEELVLIDFGLSYYSERDEDKAVDVHLFKQALLSKHHKVYGSAVRKFLKGYRSWKGSEKVLERLKKVEARGKNKNAS